MGASKGVGIGTPHSKIWGGGLSISPPPHEMCYNKLYIYILNLV